MEDTHQYLLSVENLVCRPALLRVACQSLNTLEAGSYADEQIDLADSYLESPMAQLQVGYSGLLEAGSRCHFEILRQWLKHCDEKHLDCRPVGEHSLPTRLIDVGTTSDPSMRLYETRKGDHMVYLALSHPWGQPPHFCTSRSNLDQFKQSMEFHEVPATFQDAITVTRNLGIRYLWIDSICIVQGPEGDFASEAKRMEDVFSQAYCVLAGSSAKGQNDGFLKPRMKRKYIPFRCGKNYIYVSEFIDDFERYVLKSRLNQRGWVLQERALARRTIYFTSEQCFWKCGDGVRCETMTKMNK